MFPGLHKSFFCLFCLAIIVLGGCASSRSGGDQDRDYFDGGALTDPEPMTLVLTGRVLKAQGRLVESEAVLRRTINDYPGFGPAYAELAELLIKDERTGEAILVLQGGIAETPLDPILQNDLGMCFLLSGDLPRARVAFGEARRLDPDDATYTANLAMICGLQGFYDESLALYYEVIPHAEAHMNVSRLARAQGDLERADADRAIALRSSG